jgi:hypothetical protein
VRVDLGRAQARVAEQLLQVAQVSAIFALATISPSVYRYLSSTMAAGRPKAAGSARKR